MNVEIWHINGMRFHFGQHGLGQEKTGSRFPSDSMFAALVARIAILHGQDAAKSFGERFTGYTPPFVLSSAFPRAGKILFFPPPQRQTITGDGSGNPKHKNLKKIAYVSESVFRSLLTGSTLRKQWNQNEKLHNDTVLLTAQEAATLHPEVQNGNELMWKIIRQPRVTIDRADNSSTIYHTGQIVFNQDCGLWVGLRWLESDPDLANLMPNLFQELGDAGLGGERSCGFGICEINQADNIQFPQALNKFWVSLSRYIPQQNEIQALQNPHAAYKVESVEGWVQSSYGQKDERRKIAHMLVEGSVFGPLETDAPGQMVDTQPSYGGANPLGHPAWRNGIALSVGLEMRG